jgi:hypothetical protein
MPAEVSYMRKREPVKVPCSRCKTPIDPMSGITVWHSKASAVPADVRRSETDPTEMMCTGCWWSRGRPAPEPVREMPYVPPIESHYGATKWNTFAEATERHHTVMRYLGVMPNVTPRDPSMPGPYTVSPDSPLVPGWDKAKHN